MSEHGGTGPGQGTHGLGIVGGGVIGAFHAQAAAMVPGVRLVAVTDVLPDRAKAFAAERGCAAESSLGDLLSRGDIDVVSVCVPSGLHAEVGIQVAAARKHLVIEKPIDVSLDAADRLIGAAKSAGITMTVISQHRFDPGPIELRRLIDDGALGRLLLGQAATRWYRSQSYYDSAAWRGTWSLDGGALMNQGIHYADLLCWCMGPAAEVTAVTATQAHDMEAEDCALAIVRFASGAVGTLTASTAVFPGFAQRLEISGTDGTVIIEDSVITYRGFRGDLPDPGMTGSSVLTGATVPAVASSAADLEVAAHAAQLADLLAALDERREPQVTAADGRATLELVCAVYESARQGRPVTLPMRADGAR